MSASTFKSIYPKEGISTMSNTEIALLLFEIKGIVDSLSDIYDFDETIPHSLIDRLQERVNDAVSTFRGVSS